MDKKRLASMMDHTLLKADATDAQIEALCAEAAAIGAASVCVNSARVALAKRLLAGSGVLVDTVVGFPLGANTPEVKAFEAKDAIARGADEVDMVINIGALKSGDEALVQQDIQAVVGAAQGATVKVILETCYLNDEEITAACRLALEAGADFVKTSTGFGTGGATAEDVRLMRSAVGDRMKIKASGGIRDYAAAMEMVAASADRLGVSASLAILEGAPETPEI
ncbi:MAG: deoxyribose-phosphate aldolase [Clostridiales Family XIII bacterium]|jgi:deoxyribose-phosphate aldolase|nr:deoxyribose-phosphate aldolase [Clostridiales Family XIII bacterium]